MSELKFPHLARLATSLLGRFVPDEGPRPIGNRAASVAALRAALTRRRRQRVGRGLLAVAAVAVLVGGVVLQRGLPSTVARRSPAPAAAPIPAALTAQAISLAGGPTTLARAGRSQAVGGPVGLQAGDRLRTGQRGRLAVALSSGTRLDLAPEGDLELGELGRVQRFRLRGGRVQASVAKLHAGERFLIHTGDAEVEVRGTSFEVVLHPPGATCPRGEVTEVRVFEGSVAVRGVVPQPEGERRIRAGTIWQTPCPPEPPAPAPAPAPRAGRVARAAQAAPVVTTIPSTLREQNDLFGAALTARGRGDRAGALLLLDDLLRRYPTGPLADSARRERRELVGR